MGKRHPQRTSSHRPNQPRKGRLCSPYRLARFELLEDRWVLSLPTIAPIPDMSILQGAPLPVALQGADADAGDVLTYQVEVSDPTAVTVLQTDPQNPTLRLVVEGFGPDGTDGVMTFQLFKDRTPLTVQRFVELVNSGFYNGKTFHRVITDVQIVGGGEAGTGYLFDDEFHTDLQFTRDGILAMAGPGDDDNDSQFLITDSSARQFDFNYTIFGFLTSGDDVREAIQAVSNDNGVPNSPPVIKSASIVTDTRNDVVLFKLNSVPSTPIQVTVRVSDGSGLATEPQTFTLNPYADEGTFNNSHPYLPAPLPPVETVANTPVSILIEGIDVEGDPMFYGADLKPSHPSISVTVPSFTQGLVNISPTNGVIGAYWLNLRVYSDRGDDTQAVPLFIKPAAPTTITLLNPSASGSTVTNRDNSPSKPISFQVDGVHAGTEVTIYADGQLIGSATATGSTVVVTSSGNLTLANGQHQITAIQALRNQKPPDGGGNYRGNPVDLVSAASSPFALTIDVNDAGDTTPPVFTTEPVLGVGFGKAYRYDANTNEVSSFRLVESPSDMTVEASTGVITWTAPTPLDLETGLPVETDYNVTLEATDLSGNTARQTFTVHVGTEPEFLDGGSDQEVDEGTPISVTVRATDDKMPLTFTLVDGPGGNAKVVAIETGSETDQSAEFTWTPDESFGPGTYTIQIAAIDSTHVPTITTFTVTVNEVNESPTIAEMALQHAAEGVTFTFQIPGADADLPANKLEYSVEGAPDGMVVDADTGVIRWTPTETDGGTTTTVQVRVTDEHGASAEAWLSIEVAEHNQAPTLVISGTVPTRVRQGQQVRIQYLGTDPDSPPAALTYRFVGTPPDGMTLDASTGLLTWTVPEEFPAGAVTFTVEAAELTGQPPLSAQIALTVEVLPEGSGIPDVVRSLVDYLAALAIPANAGEIAPILSPAVEAAIADLPVENIGGGAAINAVIHGSHVLGDNGMFGSKLGPDTGRGGLTAEQRESEEGSEPNLEQALPRGFDSRPARQGSGGKSAQRRSSEAYDEALEALLADAQHADQAQQSAETQG